MFSTNQHNIETFKKNEFSINFYYTLFYFENKLNKVNSLLSHSYNLGLSYTLKKFTFDFIVSNNGKYLRGEYITKGEASSTLQISYTNGDFSCFVGILQPFNKSIDYHSRLVRNAALEKTSTSDFYDNGQMVYLKLSYYFSFGKEAKDIYQKLYNKDSDSGVFKAE